jgi:hypothetical protein
MGWSQSSLLRIFKGPSDVKIGCGWGEDRSGVACIFLLGIGERKWCIMVFIQGHLKKNRHLAMQVTEMLCIYCLKATSNPSTHTHNTCSGREEGVKRE